MDMDIDMDGKFHIHGKPGKDLLSWQFSPEKPAGQRHTYALTVSIHVPLFWHGLLPQLSTSTTIHIKSYTTKSRVVQFPTFKRDVPGSVPGARSK